MPNYVVGRIRQHFESIGLRQVENSVAIGLPGHPISVFEGQGRIIAVLALSRDELTDRNSLIRAVVRSTSMSGKANEVYLAMPKSYASSIDAELLTEHGVGLLTFDERRVAIALPARKLDVVLGPARREPSPSTSDDLIHLDERVASLERALGLMEDKMETVLEEIERLRTEMGRIAASGVRIASTETPVVLKAPRVSQGLPSYLQENPWLEVLVERGQP